MFRNLYSMHVLCKQRTLLTQYLREQLQIVRNTNNVTVWRVHALLSIITSAPRVTLSLISYWC